MPVKVPPLLHKMSLSAQKAWYKKNNMEMPASKPDEVAGKSAAAAKKIKLQPRKAPEVAAGSIRAINAARQKAYMAKGGRQPIGATGSGGSNVMAGSNMSTAKGIVAGIKAGFNPKVSLNPYEGMTAKEKKSMKKEEVEQIEEGNPANKAKKKEAIRQLGLKAMAAGKVDKTRGYIPQRAGREMLKKEEAEMNEVTKAEAEKVLGGPVKTKPKMPPGKQPAGYRYVRGLARKAMKAGMKKDEYDSPARKAMERELQYNPKYRMEEVEQVEEGKIAKALAVGAMSLASMGAKAHTDTTKSVAQLAQERPALAQRLKDIGATGQVPASDKRAAELQKKQDQEMPASERRAKELKKEETEQVDEANMRFDPEAAARPKSSDVKNFLNRNKNARAGAASKKYIRRMTKLGGLGPNQTKKDTEKHMKNYFEEVEQVDETRRMSAAEKLGRAFDSEQQRSALSRQRGLDLLKQKDTEKMQNKLASGNMTKLKKEETEESTMKYIEEKLTAADPASKWISDFVKSDNPKFAGKSKKERIQQALGAYYAKKRGTNEEVETVDEGRLRRSMRGYAVLGGYGYGNKVRYQSAGERSREINVGLDDKQEKENARRAAEADKAKMKKEEVEQMDEVNARNSFVASQQALTPRAKDVKASVGTTRRDAAVTNKYARRMSKLSGGAYSKQDVKGNLKSLAKEEAEQIDELKASTLGSYIAKSSADEKSRREKGVAVSKELSAKTGMKFGTPFDPKIHSKNASRSANRAVAIKKLTGQAKVNANEAAEGKVAVTPKEKSLAAHHGDKTKITFGDVLKARLKSAAAKKMGK